MCIARWNYNDTDCPTVAFTSKNYAGVKSEFQPVQPKPSNCSDWTLVACEIHEHGSTKKPIRTRGTAVRLDDTMQMRWVGGNISGSGEQLIHLTGTNQWIAFLGTTLYSESGHPLGKIVHNSGQAQGFSIQECFVQAQKAVFGGDPDAVYDEVSFRGKASILVSSGQVFDLPQGQLRNSIIHCDGLPLTLDAIESTLLINPGKVMARRDGSVHIGRDGLENVLPRRVIEMNDDSAASVTALPMSGLLQVDFSAVKPDDCARWGTLGYQMNNSTVTVSGGTDWHHLAPSDSAPSVQEAPKGKLSFRTSITKPGILFIVNRLGGPRTFRLKSL